MPIADDLAGIPDAFRAFCDARGIVYETAVRRDLLASTFASQLVLVAGPSGTGKSTSARVLAEFFTAADSIGILDVRPLWTGPENLLGYYSKLTQGFDEAEGLERFLRVPKGTGPTPFLILEEANLSAMETYFGNVLSALSRLSRRTVEWRLHYIVGGVSTYAKTLIPPTVALEPFPRFFGTINVDSTAGAPSAKVCGRGLTVLLEAPDIDLTLQSTSAIGAPAIKVVQPPGAGVLGDPSAAWYSMMAGQHTGILTRPIALLCELLENDLGSNCVSPRDMQRCVMFMAWHVALAEHDNDFVSMDAAATDAAELALLHVVLPGLGSGQFGVAVESLRTHATSGGLLDRRLNRVLASTKGIYGAPPDFWAALS